MPSRRSRVGPCLLGLVSVAWAGDAASCAVATSVRVENQGTSPVRSLSISSPESGVGSRPRTGLPPGETVTNSLPKRGLPPGETIVIQLPSCIGLYDIQVVFADGRKVLYPAQDAQALRGLSVR